MKMMRSQQWRGGYNNQLRLRRVLWVVAILSAVISVRLLRISFSSQPTSFVADDTNTNIVTISSPAEGRSMLFTTNTRSVSSNGANNNKEVGVRFVLFLGLEGTGHHFWQDLIKESPLFSQLKELGLHPNFTRQLTKALYRHKNNRSNGLWSATCKWENEDNNDALPNITSIQDSLVEILRNINDHVVVDRRRIKKHDEKSTPVTFPVNLLPGGGNEFGVISYPGFLKPCRSLNYPNLDVFYDACSMANVLCQHVYIYRNPYAVIRSTTDNRKFNKNKMEAIHLYTTQLRILHSQLLQFHDKVIGCWNYDTATSTSQIQYHEEIKPILQFGAEKNIFNDVLKKIFNNPSPTQPKNKYEERKIVPIELNSYMKSMVTIHDMVVRTCHNLKRKI